MNKFTKVEKRKIGERIRAARNARGLTMMQLCKKANYPTTKVLVKFENGVTVPKGERLEMLSRALHMDKEEILYGKQKAEKEFMEEKKMMTTAERTKEVNEIAAQKPAADPKHEYVRANGRELKRLREKAGLFQKDIASICNTTNFNVSAWERGKRRISMANARTLGLLYNVSANSLIKAEKPITVKRPVTSKKKYQDPDGNAIKECREKAGLSTKDIADLCGVVRGTVEFWEGEKRRISEEHAKMLAEYFSVPVEKITKQDTKDAPVTSPVEEKDKKAEFTAQKAGLSACRPKAVLQKTAVVSSAGDLNGKTEAPTAFSPLPKSPEETFCKNVRYFISKKGCSDQEFEAAVGCDPSFFDDVQKDGWNWKIPLGVVLKTARFLGKTVEELVCDTKAAEIEAMAAEYERKARELRRMLGA